MSPTRATAMICLSIIIKFLMFLLNTQEISTLTIQDFYPFGPEHNDTQLTQGDDLVESVMLPIEFPFFGKMYSTLGISTNGLLSLNSTVDDYTPRVFPTNGVLIAPFWADVDTSGIGTIYYRTTTSQTLLDRMSMDISGPFVGQVTFSPRILFIATWIEVGYFSSNTDKNNTFQCILATNGDSSFVVFLYKEGGIQWTTGDANNGTNGLGGNPATVGFNAGDMVNFALVTGSNTNSIVNISSTSNVGIPGKWAFQVNNATVTAPDPCLSSPCDQNADCQQTGLSSDFTCTCAPPYSGNGTFCTIPDPCLSQPCDFNAVCERDRGINENFTCTCLSPFVGDGFNCTIPDPCQTLPCDVNAVCRREGLLSGNFSCECQPPFTIGSGFDCSVPDPCLSQPCDPNAVCEREGLLNANFSCTCLAPFTIGDGSNCSIPDPCQRLPCDVNAVCRREGLLSGNFSCECQPPFTIGNGFDCSVPDPCLSQPCDPNAVCERKGLLNANFSCTCLVPFTFGDGFNCSNPCLSTPCDPNADCEREGPLTNSFSCACRPPFIMEDNIGCIVPDPCLSTPCHLNASCERESLLSDNLTCICFPGFTGDGYSCTPLTENGKNSPSVFQRYEIPIVIALSILGLIVLILLIGIVYGYVSVSKTMYKRIKFDSQTEVNGEV